MPYECEIVSNERNRLQVKSTLTISRRPPPEMPNPLVSSNLAGWCFWKRPSSLVPSSPCRRRANSIPKPFISCNDVSYIMHNLMTAWKLRPQRPLSLQTSSSSQNSCCVNHIRSWPYLAIDHFAQQHHWRRWGQGGSGVDVTDRSVALVEKWVVRNSSVKKN